MKIDMKAFNYMTEDTKAVLLLCGVFGKQSDRSEFKPFTIKEYNQIASWLRSRNYRPRNLLSKEIVEELKNELEYKIDFRRLNSLLERGALLAFTSERWINNGIWIATRSDENYPTILRKKLSSLSPPIMYGVGDPNLYSGRKVAIVGSRTIGEDAEYFTKKS